MKTTNLLPKVFGILMMAGSLALVGCGESDDTKTATQVDTREVTKQPEPQAPSLEQKLEPSSQASEAQTTAPAPVEEVQTTEANVEAVSGQSLYTTCIGCHGAAGEGGVGPKLAGQTADNLTAKMKAYRAGEQVGPMTAMMAPMAASLTDDEIDALADYITTF